MPEKTIITYFRDRNQLLLLLEKNPGLIIIKLGASWCRPCKTIKPVVDAFFKRCGLHLFSVTKLKI